MNYRILGKTGLKVSEIGFGGEWLDVEPVLQNETIGSQLLEYAIKEHNADHPWALEKNEKAIRFYERHGFTATGEKKLEEGTTEYLILLKKDRRILVTLVMS